MMGLLKKILPKPVRRILVKAKQQTLDHWRKKILARKMSGIHPKLLRDKKNKTKIKVLFLVVHRSVWKVDLVFRKMLDEPLFEPCILVCPEIKLEKQQQIDEIYKTVNYFLENGYPVISSYNKETNSWIELQELDPDVVFFTNPHGVTSDNYYKKAYLNYLTCYVPYYSDVASNYDVHSAYNGFFHNAVWLYFSSSLYSFERARRLQSNKGCNLILSGMPNLEALLMKPKAESSVWKKAGNRLRVIYAPHQSILKSDVLHLSTFLEVGDFIRSVSEKFKDKIQWSFKPHPLLRQKLYKHPDWGKERTDSYYDYWENSEHTQLDNGDYIELFKTSDAIIHDCGSFVFDYLLTGKPAAYLVFNAEQQLKAVNSFGKEALGYHHILASHDEIRMFIEDLVGNRLSESVVLDEFYETHVKPLYEERSPSDFIVETIKSKLLKH